MELGLKGKTAIVTGGASNIGRAISIALATEGVNVVIADIDQKQAEKVVGFIDGKGGTAVAVTTDLTRYDQVETMVKKALDRFKNLDILINDVGWDVANLFVETTPEFWDKIIGINYRAMLNCCKVILPHMIERKSGTIVTIASDAGRTGEPREGVYAGCKGAQIALSKTLAKEVGRYGIRVNVVCPGWTPGAPDEVGDHSMYTGRTIAPEILEKAAKAYPLGRLCRPQDVAGAVVFMASDAAGFITGQTLSVSGGYTTV